MASEIDGPRPYPFSCRSSLGFGMVVEITAPYEPNSREWRRLARYAELARDFAQDDEIADRERAKRASTAPTTTTESVDGQ